MQKEYDYAESTEAVSVMETPRPVLPASRLSEERIVKISKKMSALLRHAKEERFLRRDGWVPVDTMLKKLHCSRADLLRVVEGNNKQRFSVGKGADSGKEYVRANQGHSIPVQLEMRKITDPNTTAMHGTSKKAWEAIQKTGLNRMNRQHIHMAAGLPGHVISGMRATSKVVIVINVALAMADGIEFFESDNGVILSAGKDGIIEPKYFKEIKMM